MMRQLTNLAHHSGWWSSLVSLAWSNRTNYHSLSQSSPKDSWKLLAHVISTQLVPSRSSNLSRRSRCTSAGARTLQSLTSSLDFFSHYRVVWHIGMRDKSHSQAGRDSHEANRQSVSRFVGRSDDHALSACVSSRMSCAGIRNWPIT